MEYSIRNYRDMAKNAGDTWHQKNRTILSKHLRWHITFEQIAVSFQNKQILKEEHSIQTFCKLYWHILAIKGVMVKIK